MEPSFFLTQGLTVGYRGVPLIQDVEICLNRGEILSLIGPNGAGKTTILKHIIRQMEPICGTVCLDGRDIGKIPGQDLAKQMSVLLTDRVRPELMTCEDVVAAGRYPYTGKFGILSPEDRQMVREAMALMSITELAARNFLQTSDGQKQRVMLARAICQEPGLLILDEPTAYLDIRYKIELLDILRKMAREKQIAVIMSLHEIDLAMKISDRILCVKADGGTVFGSPEEVSKICPIGELYGLEKGSYNALYGSVELAMPVGEPAVFVVGGGGFGIPFYRELQKRQIPFAAGVLYENDIDYPVAKGLSSHVISAPAFSVMQRQQLDAAADWMERCSLVIDAGTPARELNALNRELLSLAREKGIPVQDHL
ncbi:MAG: ABC transporter ATP-binding protein [Eubacteriales bacterium]|nr:ABC transporter ATP-binding protein [Eubacteriales bacterium]